MSNSPAPQTVSEDANPNRSLAREPTGAGKLCFFVTIYLSESLDYVPILPRTHLYAAVVIYAACIFNSSRTIDLVDKQLKGQVKNVHRQYNSTSLGAFSEVLT